jgi:hypothetical protein
MNAEPPSFSFFSLPSGFFLLPISLTGDAPCQPHLYVKVHRENDDDEEEEEGMHRRQTNNDGGRSSSSNNPHAVFVVGLPLLWRPLAPVLESLFGAYGDVEAVAVHPDQVRSFLFSSFLLVFFWMQKSFFSFDVDDLFSPLFFFSTPTLLLSLH